ncbi:hypothetical protein QOT17_018899 [Balamuthia mandrillaris]
MKTEEKVKEPLRARTNSWIKRAGMKVGESLRRTSSSNNGDIKEGWRAATIPDGQNNGNRKGTAEKASSSSVPSTPSAAWSSPDPSWRDSASLISPTNQKMARQRSKNSINNGNNNNHDVLATDQSPNTEKQKQQPSKSNTSADNNRNHNNWRGSETVHKFVREGSWITEEKEKEEDDGGEEDEGFKMNSGRAWRGRRVRKREKERIVAEGMAALLCGLSDEEEAWHGEYEGATPKRQLLIQV